MKLWLLSLIIALLSNVFVSAQENSSMGDYLSAIFSAELREYNQMAGQPLTVEEAKQRSDIFYRAIKQFSGQSPGDYSQLKAGFEVAMVSANAGTPITYNREARSVYDALCWGKANCVAGTNLYIGAAIKAWGEAEIRKHQLAVIFSEGHVQAGYFLPNANGGWDLHRVETTSTNVSSQNLGSTKALSNYGPLRVLLVEDYLKMEANRLAGVSNEKIKATMLPDALDRVAQLGVPVVELEKLIQKVPNSSSVSFGSDRATPLAFGVSAAPSGDRERQATAGSINGEWWPESSRSNVKSTTNALQQLPTERDFEVLNKYLQLEKEFGQGNLEIFQPWIYNSIDHRLKLMAHPWVQDAIQQQPSLRQKIEDFYDAELVAYIKKQFAPYDGSTRFYKPELYNFQLRLGRNFNGRFASGYTYVRGASSNYDYENEAQFILDLIANPSTWGNYLGISSQVQGGANTAGELLALPLIASPADVEPTDLMRKMLR